MPPTPRLRRRARRRSVAALQYNSEPGNEVAGLAAQLLALFEEMWRGATAAVQVTAHVAAAAGGDVRHKRKRGGGGWRGGRARIRSPVGRGHARVAVSG